MTFSIRTRTELQYSDSRIPGAVCQPSAPKIWGHILWELTAIATIRARTPHIQRQSQSTTIVHREHSHPENGLLYHRSSTILNHSLRSLLNKKLRKCIFFRPISVEWVCVSVGEQCLYVRMCVCAAEPCLCWHCLNSVLHYCKLPDKCCANDAMPQNRLTSYAILDSLFCRIRRIRHIYTYLCIHMIYTNRYTNRYFGE